MERDLDRATAIFIDSDLCDEMPGERFAWSLFDAGFTRLYLATGFDAERFPALPWLKGVLGKDPPDWSLLDHPGDDPLAAVEQDVERDAERDVEPEAEPDVEPDVGPDVEQRP